MMRSSSTALRISSGVTSATAFLSSALSVVVFASSGRWRSTLTWRCSNSVFVIMSPFTLTSTCSRISARAGSRATNISSVTQNADRGRQRSSATNRVETVSRTGSASLPHSVSGPRSAGPRHLRRPSGNLASFAPISALGDFDSVRRIGFSIAIPLKPVF